MRCLHPFVLVSWFRGFVRRRPSIVFVVVFIEVVGFWCGGARVSSSSGLFFFFFSADKFLGTTPTEMDWTMGFCDPDVDDDVFTHASASALDEKLFCVVVIEKVE